MTKKKKNPFAGYQAKKVDTRESFIETYLQTVRKTRAKFEFVTDLAKAVADQIAMVEKKPCAASTLLRNKRYKALLLNFMATQAGMPPKPSPTDSAASKLLVVSAELEAAGLKREVERLKAYITTLERQADEAGTKRLSAPGGAGSAPLGSDYSTQYAMACKALWQVLDHFKELVSVDLEGEKIIDRSAPKKSNVIADATVAGAFFEWLRSNKGVGA